MAMIAGAVAGAAAKEVGKNAATAAATHATVKATGKVARPKVKSPTLGGVDVAMILATTGIGVAISWIGTGRWTRLKRAYTDLPT